MKTEKKPSKIPRRPESRRRRLHTRGDERLVENRYDSTALGRSGAAH